MGRVGNGKPGAACPPGRVPSESQLLVAGVGFVNFAVPNALGYVVKCAVQLFVPPPRFTVSYSSGACAVFAP